MKQEYWERDFSTDQRDALAKSGDAMPDGSYPIANVSDLKNAIQASGRAKNAAAVKAHIKTRAKALGQTALIPDTWESSRVMVTSGEAFQESAYDPSAGKLTLTVIKPGVSKNNRYYSPELLKNSAKIFEGAKMFADHQTDKEAQNRPEGSVKDWVGTIQTVWPEADGTLKATAVVVDPQFKAKLDSLNTNKLLSQMGVSIRAVGEASDGHMEGKRVKVIESLLAARSVDFVTFAGAGGQVDAIESAVDEFDIDLVNEAQLRKRRPDLVELIESRKETKRMRTQEAYCPPMTADDHDSRAASFQSKADELKAGDKKDANQAAADAHGKAASTARDAAKAAALASLHEESDRGQGDDVINAKMEKDLKEANEKITALESEKKKATAKAELTKLLAEAKLPDVAVARINKHFETAESTDGMKEMIASEQDYVKSLSGSVKKHNGAGDNKNADESDPAKAKANLKESFKRNFGVDDKQAEIMAQ